MHGRVDKTVQGFGGKVRRKDTTQNGSWGDQLPWCGVDSTGLGEGLVAGSSECSDETSGSSAREFVSYGC
jgi:hypothetical protein